MSSLDVLVAQQKLMSTWAGRPLDQRGLLRVLNEDGSRRPLFWIFNAAHEPIQLSGALEIDQPIIFSRSSHLLVLRGDDPAPTRNILSTYLSHEIQRHFPHTEFDMGTSCQGSSMVMSLSLMLRERGIDVHNLCMINCQLPEIQTMLPALMVYGSTDEKNNPFVDDETGATDRANLIFSRYRRMAVPARHGQFYEEGSVEKIVAQFEVFRSASLGQRSIKRASSSTVG